MTKTKIKAELRRSACEDERPAHQERTPCETGPTSWYGVFVMHDGLLSDLSFDDQRTFFLLVAEAL